MEFEEEHISKTLEDQNRSFLTRDLLPYHGMTLGDYEVACGLTYVEFYTGDEETSKIFSIVDKDFILNTQKFIKNLGGEFGGE